MQAACGQASAAPQQPAGGVSGSDAADVHEQPAIGGIGSDAAVAQVREYLQNLAALNGAAPAPPAEVPCDSDLLAVATAMPATRTIRGLPRKLRARLGPMLRDAIQAHAEAMFAHRAATTEESERAERDAARWLWLLPPLLARSELPDPSAETEGAGPRRAYDLAARRVAR